MTLPDEFVSNVVGLSFHEGYPENLYRIAELSDAAEARGEALVAKLRREPDNPHDANAIAVYVGPELLGHLPRTVAAKLAPRMATERWGAQVEKVRIHPDNPQNPGLDVRVWSWG